MTYMVLSIGPLVSNVPSRPDNLEWWADRLDTGLSAQYVRQTENMVMYAVDIKDTIYA